MLAIIIMVITITKGSVRKQFLITAVSQMWDLADYLIFWIIQLTFYGRKAN